MSYDPRQAGRPFGDSDVEDGARKGSVRAARERMQAARIQEQLPDRSRIVGLPQRPNQGVQQRSSPPTSLTPPDSRGNPIAVSPTPQWPLSNSTEDALDSSPVTYANPSAQGTTSRPAPPQRPPRPTSDELPIQPTSPSDYRESYQSDEYLSPTSATVSSRPLTTSSAASEASSLGSIPDFPVPQPPLPMPTVQPLPRRLPTLGPPPSARRGPSSYYTNMSYVSPIIEESERNSEGIRSHHGSFASSNVIPSNGDDFYMDQRDQSDDEETVTSDYGRDSRASNYDEKSELVATPALVRQASLGRRTKPSLMTIKSIDTTPGVKRKPMETGVGAGAIAGGIGGAVLAARDGIAGQRSPTAPEAAMTAGNSFFDRSDSSSDSVNAIRTANAGTGSMAFRNLDPEKNDPDSPVNPLQQGVRQAQPSERLDRRRPPRLDIDAVRDAEARGSLTSLPELIRRATKLAANLDRGKTASRLGLDFWEAGAPNKERYESRRSGSIRGMLAAFPPPGEATPTGGWTPDAKNRGKWPSPLGPRGTSSELSSRASNGRRRCCGMPMWTFVTLLIVLLFLVAAAVVIPVVLIVLPKMKANSANNLPQSTGTATSASSAPMSLPTSSGQTGQCDGVISCQNDGVAVMNADRSCNCVCINGFTGKTCATKGDAGCTTTNIEGTASNATIGSGIPRLISSAQSNFSVPLDAAQLLPIFSDLSMSCSTENALVTFNGLASRSVPQHETSLDPSRTLPLLQLAQHDQGMRRLDPRQAIGAVGNANANAAVTSTSSASGASTTSSAPISSNATALDFARIGVLLALQESKKLDTAANAQSAVQKFLSKDEDDDDSRGDTVDMGPFTINLVDLSIAFSNGTTLDAKPSATTSS